jgi:23S rRNA (guanosine2251-2'-O)-methyltransferase
MAKLKAKRTGKARPGTGGKNRDRLAGKGATPKAKDRKNHKAYQAPGSAKKRTKTTRATPRSSSSKDLVFGRNSVLEVLREKVPATALILAERMDSDPRVQESITLAKAQGIEMLMGNRTDLDRMTADGAHQGMVLKVAPYKYAEAASFLGKGPIVVLDSITDPRNLGAIARSAAAFGAAGIVVGERRGVGVTAAAWKTSAGALARIKVAQVTNITRQLKAYQDAGAFVIGLTGDSKLELTELTKKQLAGDLVLVVGAEGEGLSRLIAESCDYLVRIPINKSVESLNASVAASIALYEMNRIKNS